MAAFSASRCSAPPERQQRPSEAVLNVTIGEDTTVISPVTLVEMPDDHPGPPRITILGFTIVRLDPAVIRDSMLTSLTARHFHGNDSEGNYRLAVVQRSDPATVVWESEPGLPNVSHLAIRHQSFLGTRRSDVRVCERGRAGCPHAAPSTAIPVKGAGNGNLGFRNPIPDPGSRIPTETQKSSSMASARTHHAASSHRAAISSRRNGWMPARAVSLKPPWPRSCCATGDLLQRADVATLAIG